MSDDVLYRQHPAMFRNHPIGFCLCLIPIFWPALFVWWLGAIGTMLTITSYATVLRTGIVAKHINEVAHRDVRQIQVSQGILQRIFGVGTIGIASAGHSDVEIVVAGIRTPQKVRELINGYRKGP